LPSGGVGALRDAYLGMAPADAKQETS